MTGIKLSSEERAALQGLSYFQIALYSMGIRPHMDFSTRTVGQKFGISWQSLREELYVEPIPGQKGKTPSKSAVRRAAARLEQVGLIKIFSSKNQLLIECIQARQDNCAQITPDICPAPPFDTIKYVNITEGCQAFSSLPDIVEIQKAGTIPVSGNTKEKTNTTSVVLAKKKISRALQLSEMFHVKPCHIMLAQQNGWPSPEGEICAFRDYHLARGTKMMDWDRAFYTWLRNAKKFKEGRKNGASNGASRREQAIISTIETCIPDGYQLYG